MADALVELLRLEGVSRVFGIPGGALVSFQQSLSRANDITFHLCRQETGAAYIADGYARVSGGLGVVVTTSGPGATNALTGVMNAQAAQTQLFVLTGEAKESTMGRGYLQEGVDCGLDVVDVFRNAIEFSELISNPANAVELFQAAMRHSRTAPYAASHLSLPGDVAAQPLPTSTLPPSPAAYRATGEMVDADGLARALAALNSAQRPLIMLGNRCREALADQALLDSFIAAIEHLSIPVITDAEAKGIFPESHELSLRNFGFAGCQWPAHYMTSAAGQYDALLVIGCGLGQLATDSWNQALVPNGPFVQVADDPMQIGQAFPVTSGVVSSIGAVLRHIADVAWGIKVDSEVATARRDLVSLIKQTVSPFADAESRDSDGTWPIKPQALMRILGDAMTDGGHIMVDAGNCVGWCMNYLVIDPPTRLHSSLVMGPMGCAMSVIGAKLAAPDLPCVAVIGDGAFMMHAAEVATAAQYGVGAIWIVLADHQLNMVSQGMATVLGDTSFDSYYEIGWTDLAAVAQGYGARTWTVSTAAEASAALAEAMAPPAGAAGVPAVIVVDIDATQMPPFRYPMLQKPPAPPT